MKKFNQGSDSFLSNFKKAFSLAMIMLSLTSCNNSNQDLLSNILNNEQSISTYSQTTPEEGDERGGEPKLSSIESDLLNPEKLPALPTLPVYAVFNNDYKGLYADNEVLAHNDPKNTDKYFFKLVNSAKTSIDASIFDIDDPTAAAALIAAKQRGVTVRVVTDGENLKDKVDETLPRAAVVDLKAAGIDVRDDGTRSAFMHNKFMVVDNQWVWTGSYNLTSNAMYRDNNNIVLINSPEVAANFNAEFKRLFEQGIFNSNPHEMPNQIVNLPDYTVKTYFSPGGGTKDAIINVLKNAQKSIKFMAFSFTDGDMADIIEQKSKLPGFKAEGVLDKCEISKYSVYDRFRKAGIWVKPDGNQALMHHKIMIVDDKTVITGSFNFSKNAEKSNNENTVIIDSPTLARVYNSEYSRIKNAAIHNTGLPPYDHPACNH